MDASSLVLGTTYFRVTFADRDLTMPGIEPMVFIGRGEFSDSKPFLAFQDTVSYVQYGSRLEPGAEDREDQDVFLLSPDEIGNAVLDLAGVLAQVQLAHSRAVELEFPQLPSALKGSGNVT